MVFDTLILNSSTKFLNCFEPAPSRPIESRVWIDTPQYRVTNTFENNFSMGWVKNDMAGTKLLFFNYFPQNLWDVAKSFPKGANFFPTKFTPSLIEWNEKKRQLPCNSSTFLICQKRIIVVLIRIDKSSLKREKYFLLGHNSFFLPTAYVYCSFGAHDWAFDSYPCQTSFQSAPCINFFRMRINNKIENVKKGLKSFSITW